MANIRFHEPMVVNVQTPGVHLPPPSPQTAAAIAAYPPPTHPPLNYEPADSSVAGFLASSGSGKDPVDAGTAGALAGTSHCDALSNMTNGQVPAICSGDAPSSLAMANHQSPDQSPAGSDPSTTNNDGVYCSSNSSEHQPSNNNPGPPASNDKDGERPLPPNNNAPIYNPGSQTSNSKDSEHPPSSSDNTSSRTSHNDGECCCPNGAADSQASSEANNTRQSPANNNSPNNTAQALSSADKAPAKKKQSKMGPAEKALAWKAASAQAEKLSRDIDEFLEEQQKLFEKVAEVNDITVERIKKLVNQSFSSASKKKASNHNILVFFKARELNKELHALVKDDEDLQEIAQDPEAMVDLCEKYEALQAEKKITAIQVSKTGPAKMVAVKVNELQIMSNFVFDAADASTFGIVIRGSFESSVRSSFWGWGPADAFL
ncbi:hypothetical protein GYMLUDRAFT_59380 [Collybiopsis luxurians FD-317 M1]|uniref:Uncharacterized protein n=1 Tax=Collybiopsis luxurians FD-317 M1 TaxID=944289 RepID=A0A0D0BAA8_9AGAR|nr:hypothetical protein GYMLUDRAFT_59380 [Collybiopsis luxurians FD-317 M1]